MFPLHSYIPEWFSLHKLLLPYTSCTFIEYEIKHDDWRSQSNSPMSATCLYLLVHNLVGDKSPPELLHVALDKDVWHVPV